MSKTQSTLLITLKAKGHQQPRTITQALLLVKRSRVSHEHSPTTY